MQFQLFLVQNRPQEKMATREIIHSALGRNLAMAQKQGCAFPQNAATISCGIPKEHF
jgi:hypothetical protein